MFEWVFGVEGWIALSTLMALEIVLGVDNIIFISILVGRLPPQQRDRARRIGLALAMLSRLALLFSLVWVMSLIEPVFQVFGHQISGRDIILILGGLFLLAKSTHEIHTSLEVKSDTAATYVAASFTAIIVQIATIDVVFSLDSVITAVGLVEHVSIMVIAIIAAVLVMLFSAKPIGDFVDNNPTIKMLALSFLLLIGMTLICEGFEVHIPKGYIYFAMAFSFVVEMLNIKVRSLRADVKRIQLTKKIVNDE